MTTTEYELRRKADRKTHNTTQNQKKERQGKKQPCCGAERVTEVGVSEGKENQRQRCRMRGDKRADRVC
jgi:hypothetical protein